MEATKKPQNYLRIIGRLFPQNLGGLFPQNLGGLTPAQNTKKNPPLGFEPKCAATVLLKHTMYNYSGHPAYYSSHTQTLRAGHRRVNVVLLSSTFSFSPHEWP